MCKGGREWGGVCKRGGECLKACNSVRLGAVRGILHRGECARGVRGCARGVHECARACEGGGECVRVGVSACVGLKVCNSVSLGAVRGFCIKVSVKRVCKGCVSVCRGVQEWI